jgi:hypothetical protein
MTDKTEAMDNLIAQDADLIEICAKDLVRRLRRTYRKEFAATGSMFADNSNRLCPFPILAAEVLFNPDGTAAADLIQAQAAEIERLNKSAECLAESRRLAVKDVAALEEHMRIEIGQWKVDYDCAIMDVKQLREWVTALEVLLDCAVADYCDQNGRPKHDSHWVNQSRAILEQNK